MKTKVNATLKWLTVFWIYYCISIAEAAPADLSEKENNEFVFILPAGNEGSSLFPQISINLEPPISSPFKNARDSYGNPVQPFDVVGDDKNNEGDKKILNTAGLRFAIPSYASGITELKKPTNDLLPPLGTGKVPEDALQIPVVPQPSIELLPPLDDNNVPPSLSSPTTSSDVKSNEITNGPTAEPKTELRSGPNDDETKDENRKDKDENRQDKDDDIKDKDQKEIKPIDNNKTEAPKYDGEKYTGGFGGPPGVLGKQLEKGYAIKEKEQKEKENKEKEEKNNNEKEKDEKQKEEEKDKEEKKDEEKDKQEKEKEEPKPEEKPIEEIVPRQGNQDEPNDADEQKKKENPSPVNFISPKLESDIKTPSVFNSVFSPQNIQPSINPPTDATPTNVSPTDATPTDVSPTDATPTDATPSNAKPSSAPDQSNTLAQQIQPPSVILQPPIPLANPTDASIFPKSPSLSGRIDIGQDVPSSIPTTQQSFLAPPKFPNLEPAHNVPPTSRIGLTGSPPLPAFPSPFAPAASLPTVPAPVVPSTGRFGIYTGGFGGAPGILGVQEKPGYAVQPDGSIRDPDHTYRPPGPGTSIPAQTTAAPVPTARPIPATPVKYDKYTGGFGGPPGILAPFDKKQ